MEQKLLLLGVCILIALPLVMAAYPDGGYDQRKNLTIVSTANINDFPVNLNITYDNDMQADFDDLRFQDSAGHNLYAELESKTDSQNAYVWVKTNLSTGNNIVSVYYGNSTVSSSWDTSGNVWDDYVLVAHMNTTDGKDSSSIGNDGSASGNPTVINGKWGNSVNFDQVGDYVTFSANNAYNFTGKDYTIEAFVYDNDDESENEGIINSYLSGNTGTTYWYVINGWGNDIKSRFYDVIGGVTELDVTGNNGIGTWFYVSTQYMTNTSVYFYNGLTNSANGVLASQRIGTSYTIMVGLISTSYWNGTMDELRVSNVNRDFDWKNMTYQLIANHAGMVTYGSEENYTEEAPPVGDEHNVSLNYSYIIIDDDSQNAATGVTGYMDDIVDGGTSYGDWAINWDISSIPSGGTITLAQACFYINADHCDDAGDEVQVWGVKNYAWTATPRNTWSNYTAAATAGVTISNFANYSVPTATGAGWCIDLTSWVNSEYQDGLKNFTVNMIVTYDADGYDDYFTVRTKEAATPADRPYLNITYSTETPSDSCTYGGSGDWVVTDNCNWTTNTNVLGNLYIKTGYITNLNAIFNMNHNKIIIDYTSRLQINPGGNFK